MNKYDYILFDLDGTLSDSAPGIINSVIYSLNHMRIDESDKKKLTKFVGPPLDESFSMYYGLSPDQTKTAVGFFREYYQDSGILENSMYTGVDNLLKRLRGSGKILIVATSKPEPFAKIILQRYGINSYFSFIAGSTIDEKRTRKAEVISYALESCKIYDRSKAIMVGDRAHDMIGAKENGIDCVGVLYGYGEREELEEAGAAFIAEDIDELARILL
jgi:phosphoglycolate phosphatase